MKLDRNRDPLSHVRVAVAIGGLFALFLLALLTPRGAMAHAELERSEPPSEGLLAAPPRTLSLWFTERIDAQPTIQVLIESGAQIAVSEIAIDPNDPRHVTAKLGTIAPGVITVLWSVRSIDDGHQLSGSFAFRAGAGRAPGSAAVEGERPRAWAIATRWLTFLGAALAAAGCVFGLVVTRDRELPRIARQRMLLAAGGASAGLIATLAELPLQQRWPPGGAIDQPLDEVIAALPGAWWLRPLGLFASLLLIVVALRSRRSGPALQIAAMLCALGSVLGLALVSHASARKELSEIATTSEIAHQWSVALWTGGLIHLAFVWRGTEQTAAIAAARRFSKLALPLVLIGVATGIANSAFVLPSLASLWESDYGFVLIGKVALLTVPLALATWNRRALAALLTGAGRGLRATLRLEAAVVLAIVLGGSSLALLAPPLAQADPPAVADLPMPALAAHQGQDLLVHLSFSPGRAGENELGVWLTNYDGSPYQGDAPSLVRLAFSNIELASAPVLVDATSTGDGRWAVAGTQLSISGWWTIEIALRWAGQEDVIVPFHLLLPDPNLNGLEAPPVDLPADPAAEAEYLDAMALYTSVHRVRYSQVMSSHRGSTSYAVHVVNDGADGSVAGFTLDVHGGWHYVVLGESVWSQRPGEAWETSDGGNMTPPSEWDDEYVGATGFRFGRTETVNGELSRTILFAVPGTSKQVVACYVWWVGVESGRLNREMMISQSHYMLSEFSEYDAPAPINPPEGAIE